MAKGNGKIVSNGTAAGGKRQLCNNKRQAMSQLKRIKWDLRFRGENQKKFYESVEKNDVTFSVGPAGCGKTYLATYYALKTFTEKKYKNIVGIDFSQPMLNQALEKNIYQSLVLVDLTKKLTFKDNTFDAIICAGTFTCGHVGPEALLEMVRVTKTGGYISFTVRDQEWDLLPYEQTIKELEDKNLWRCMERLTTKYNLDEGVSCQLCLYEVTT